VRNLTDGTTSDLKAFQSGDDLGFYPTFHPTNPLLLWYTSWSDEHFSHLVELDIGTGESVRTPLEPKGRYLFPTSSFSGIDKILIESEKDEMSGVGRQHSARIYRTVGSATLGKEIWRYTFDGAQRAIYTSDELAVVLSSSDGEGVKLTRHNLSNLDQAINDDKVLLQSPYATELIVSPNQKWAALVEFNEVYLVDLSLRETNSTLVTGRPVMPGSAGVVKISAHGTFFEEL
jgi:hypothetical protein